MWNRQDLKARGKAAFKANYWTTVLVSLIFTLIIGATCTTSVSSNSEDIQEYLSSATPEQIQIVLGMVVAVFAAGAMIGIVLKVVDILVFKPLQVGCQKYFINNSKGEGRIDDLKEGFNNWGGKVLTMFLTNLFLALWFLLFIIPGIVKMYSYRMVPYILAEDPTLSGTDAITMSREMMNGHKWNTFVLDLSFLGWNILSILTCGILGVFYVNPYKHCTDAELYLAIKSEGQGHISEY